MATTWSYTDSPASIPRDRVRFLVGDTSQTSASLSDDEVAFLISEAGSVANQYEAAALTAEAMAARLAGMSAINKKVGDLSLVSDNGPRITLLRARAAELRAKLVERKPMFLPVMADPGEAYFTGGMDDNA